MTASIQTVEGVSRVKGYENDTGTADSLGLPAHSITYVVEGGEDDSVAYQIYLKKTPGCYTNGTTAVNIESVAGNIAVIRFYRPTYQNIKDAITSYVNNLQIAETVYRSVIWSVAIGQMGSILNPQYSITDIQLSVDGTTYSQADIELDFYNAALTDADKIIVEVS